jgi:hypothetical protein
MAVDDNDLDSFGMDAVTQRRLRVKQPLKVGVRKKIVKSTVNKPKKPLRTGMPARLKTEGLRVRGWKVNKEKVKPEQQVFELFYKAHPAIEKYQVGSIEKRKNGFLVQGRIKGRRVVDYELDVSREGTDVLVKFNLFPMTGHPLGETYRLSVMRAEKLAPKFAKKFAEFLAELRSR